MYIALLFNGDDLQGHKFLNAENQQDAEREAEKARKQVKAEYFAVEWEEDETPHVREDNYFF